MGVSYHRLMRHLIACMFSAAIFAAPVLQDVRGKITAGDLAGAAAYAEDFKTANGENAEYVEAYSWLGRAALAFKDYPAALRYSSETRRIVNTLLKTEKLDGNNRLITALGASIEVKARAMAAKGKKKEATKELETEYSTQTILPLKTRIQKNINLLTMEGRPAPALDGKGFNSKPTLLFLWAHWCGDCKSQATSMARITAKYKSRGLVVIAPTRRYGYTDKNDKAPAEEENGHIAKVWKETYAAMADVPVAINEDAMLRYGVSTTPTFALIDKQGKVRMYHAGRLSESELEKAVEALLARK